MSLKLQFVNFLLIVIFTATYCGCRGEEFLLSITPLSEGPLDRLKTMSNDFDFLELSQGVQEDSLVHLTPLDLDELLGLVNGTSTDFAWKFLDLQAMISAELAEIDTLNRASQFNLDSYHRLEEIEAFLSSKSEEFSSIAYVSVIGQGHRGNKISMISLKLRNSSMTIKPAIWLDCGIHAREWIAPATCLCAVDRLLTQGVEGPLGNFDFFIVPVVNPDGYVHTWTQSRFWRKNRRYISPACSGVDINRNFDPDFGGPSTSKIGCNENYKGKAAFSEPESQALVTTVESIIAEYGLGRFPLYLSLHAYGQFILRPHSDTENPPDNLKDLDAMAHAMLKTLEDSPWSYQYGSSASILYPVGGTSMDWAYAKGINYSFVIELPPKPSGGSFIYPAQNIRKTCSHIWQMLLAMGEHLAGQGYVPIEVIPDDGLVMDP